MTDRNDEKMAPETEGPNFEGAGLHGDEPTTQQDEASFERQAGPLLTRESKSQGRIVWEDRKSVV